MKYDASQIRDAVFQIFDRAGTPLTRISKGQQWVVQTRDGTKAILKTAAKGGLMVKAENSDNDARIIGFDADATHILAGVLLPGETKVTAYLIPKDEVEAAYRRNNREWLQAEGVRMLKHKPTTTWVLRFQPNKNASYFGYNMATVWAQYAVGSIDLNKVAAVAPTASAPKDVLERCRQEIATAYSVEPEQVRISVDL